MTEGPSDQTLQDIFEVLDSIEDMFPDNQMGLPEQLPEQQGAAAHQAPPNRSSLVNARF